MKLRLTSYTVLLQLSSCLRTPVEKIKRQLIAADVNMIVEVSQLKFGVPCTLLQFNRRTGTIN